VGSCGVASGGTSEVVGLHIALAKYLVLSFRVTSVKHRVLLLRRSIITWLRRLPGSEVEFTSAMGTAQPVITWLSG
jgi:hypothetical protein